jgi:glycosyltransferase involved in cell wall biosynthesis
MKIIQVENHPRHGGGASNLFKMTVDLLERKGHCAIKLERKSSDINAGLYGKWKAFASGIYSLSTKIAMERMLELERPDIIHVHDLYPQLVWILPACREAGVPVVMTCHNYRMTCPALFHFHSGAVCEKCLSGREYWCIRNNCRGNFLESTAFALHNVVARKLRLFTDNVTMFIAITDFARDRLRCIGLPTERIAILPNMVNLPGSPVGTSYGGYVSYVGRFSPEKGIEILLAAAKIIGTIPIRLAGDVSTMPELRRQTAENVRFVGHLDGNQLYEFYRTSKIVVLPSTWFEVCPLTALEAMGHGLPVIASRIGSLQHIVEEGVTGLLFDPGDPVDLARKIKMLWDNDDLCGQMGQIARKKAINEYSEESYYTKLMAIYKKAIQIKQTQQMVR